MSKKISETINEAGATVITYERDGEIIVMDYATPSLVEVPTTYFGWSVGYLEQQNDARVQEIGLEAFHKEFKESAEAYLMSAQNVSRRFLSNAITSVHDHATTVFGNADTSEVDVVHASYNFGMDAVDIDVHRNYTFDNGEVEENHVVLSIDNDFSQLVKDAIIDSTAGDPSVE